MFADVWVCPHVERSAIKVAAWQEIWALVSVSGNHWSTLCLVGMGEQDDWWLLSWLVVYLPLWKIWVRQLRLWNSQYMEKHVPNHQPVRIVSPFEITGYCNELRNMKTALEIAGLQNQFRKRRGPTKHGDTIYLKQQRCNNPGDITSIKLGIRKAHSCGLGDDWEQKDWDHSEPTDHLEPHK